MAKIIIKITEEEKKAILLVVRRLQGKIISIATIAKHAKMNSNRVRFIVEDLMEENKIKREVAKMYNERYVRYYYTIV